MTTLSRHRRFIHSALLLTLTAIATGASAAGTTAPASAPPPPQTFELDMHFGGLLMIVPSQPNSKSPQHVTFLGARADDARNQPEGNRSQPMPGHVPFLRVKAASYCDKDATACSLNTSTGNQDILIPLDGDDIQITALNGKGVTWDPSLALIPDLKNVSAFKVALPPLLQTSGGTPGDLLALRLIVSTGTLKATHTLHDSRQTTVQWAFMDQLPSTNAAPPTAPEGAAIDGGAELSVTGLSGSELTVMLVPMARTNDAQTNHIDMMSLASIPRIPRSFRLVPQAGKISIDVLNMPASNILQWDNSYPYDPHSIQHFLFYYSLAALPAINKSSSFTPARPFPVAVNPDIDKDGKPYCSMAVADP